MEQLKKDIENALDFITKKRSSGAHFSKYSTSFLFGTENQEGVNHILNYQDKDVFTIASSADQYLGAAYYGAKKIDIYDINRFTYYIAYLKIIAIMNLDYEEFLNFFIPSYSKENSKSFWSLRTLKKILPSLPADVAYFWDSIMFTLHQQKYGNFINPSHKHNYTNNIKRGMPFYANKEEYYRLQNILKSRPLPQFIEADILTLKDIVKSEYDIVYLSNIIECLVCYELEKYFMLSYGAEDRVEEEMIFKVCGQVLPLLKSDGTILIDYRPNNRTKQSYDLLFNNDYFEVNEIPAKFPPYNEETVTEEDTDLVLTYRPKEKGNILKCVQR